MISRRDFIKLLGINIAALASPAPLRPGLFGTEVEQRWPRVRLAQLPEYPAQVLSLVPRLQLDQAGYLMRLEARDGVPVRLPLVRTQWNLEKSADYDRLLVDYPTIEYNWAIVIHWFGNTEEHMHTVDAFLRGFNGLRGLAGRENRTSAHFLVGPENVGSGEQETPAILQTQKPGPGGIPYLASHLYYVSSADLKERNYFVRAMDDIARQQPGVRSALQEIYARPQIDPNYYTIAIEMSGYDFDNPERLPSAQQIANLIGLIWALMARYQLTASAVIGHDEIDLRKNDPGKKFMALVRYFLGLKALLDGSATMCRLVFGPYLPADGNVNTAINAYFQFVRSYLTRIALPEQVYDWEALTKFWLVTDNLAGRSLSSRLAERLVLPLGQLYAPRGDGFLNPASHEGLDLYTTNDARAFRRPVEQAVMLAFQGECVYAGTGGGCGNGPAAVFRHRKPDGAEFVSIYGHLAGLNEMKVGQAYPLGYPVGTVRGSGQADDGYLHFALAYSATWEVDLKGRSYPPFGIPESWLRARYISPTGFIENYPKAAG